MDCWTSSGVSEAANFWFAKASFSARASLASPSPLLRFDPLLRLESFRGDKLLLFKRLLRGDLLVLDGALELLTEVDVVEQQVDDMDGVRRELFFELGAYRLPDILAIGSDVDATVFDRFVLEVLCHPWLDQHMVIVRAYRPKQILHGFGRDLKV